MISRIWFLIKIHKLGIQEAKTIFLWPLKIDFDYHFVIILFLKVQVIRGGQITIDMYFFIYFGFRS